MRFGEATADGRKRLPRPPKLPRVQPPRLHQPTVHVTAMVGIAAVVSAFAAAAPSLQGSFVGGGTSARPAAVVAQRASADAAVAPHTTVLGSTGTPTFTTTVRPPANTTIGTGAGGVQTVLFSNPNSGTALASPLASDGIPVTALEAYQDAANSANASDRNCHIPWPLLAGIGRVESDHGRYGGAVLRPDGTSTRRIIGPALNGNGTEVVRDTDGGSIDGDPVYDRAVGPMQFIPSTWLIYGADGNGDGIKDPFNIFDAALAAANYLCAAGGNLSTTAGQTRAVLSYNHSTAYLNEVLGLEHTYASGDPGLIIPNAPVVVPPVPTQHPGGKPVPPPVNPGPPLSTKPAHPAGGSGGSGGSGGGSTHHPKPHPSASSSGTGSPTTGGGSTTPADPSSSTGPTTGPGSTTSDPGDPSSTTSDPTGTTTPPDTGTPSDSPTCPTSSSSDAPDPSATDGPDIAGQPTDTAAAADPTVADASDVAVARGDVSPADAGDPSAQTTDPAPCN